MTTAISSEVATPVGWLAVAVNSAHLANGMTTRAHAAHRGDTRTACGAGALGLVPITVLDSGAWADWTHPGLTNRCPGCSRRIRGPVPSTRKPHTARPLPPPIAGDPECSCGHPYPWHRRLLSGAWECCGLTPTTPGLMLRRFCGCTADPTEARNR